MKRLPAPALVFWSGWLAVLFFVLPLPGTAALRNLVFAIGLAGLGVQIWRAGGRWPGFTCLPLLKAATLLGLLSAWMILHLLLLAWYPGQSWTLWRGDWMGSWLAGCGVLLLSALLSERSPEAPRCLLTVALAILLLQLGWLLAYQLHLGLVKGLGLTALGQSPFGERDYLTGVCLSAFALVWAELLARGRPGASGVLPWRTGVLVAWVGFTLIATIALRSRNGTLLTLGLILSGAGLWLTEIYRRGWITPRRLLLAGVPALLLIAAFVWISVLTDARWRTFFETARVSTDIHANLHWLDPALAPMPVLADGSPVEESAYDRISWAAAAIEQIRAHPLGVGYGHKAFGWAVNDAFDIHTGHESSHSGLLDFTLANGLPGILLWCAFCATLLRLGWRWWRTHGDAIGLWLCAHVLAYFGRIVLDGHFSGFRLKTFIVLLCLILGVGLARHAARRDTGAPA